MRGMNSRLVLKEKTDAKVIYCYSADTSAFKGEPVVSDGEIEFIFLTEEFKTLKKSTHDEDGGQAEWLYGHLWRVIFRQGCPEKYFLATG